MLLRDAALTVAATVATWMAAVQEERHRAGLAVWDGSASSLFYHPSMLPKNSTSQVQDPEPTPSHVNKPAFMADAEWWILGATVTLLSLITMHFIFKFSYYRRTEAEEQSKPREDMSKLIELPTANTEARECQIGDKNEDTLLERAVVKTPTSQIGQIKASEIVLQANYFKQAVEQYRSMENIYPQSPNITGILVVSEGPDVTHHKINMIKAAMDRTHQEMNQMPDRVEELEEQGSGPLLEAAKVDDPLESPISEKQLLESEYSDPPQTENGKLENTADNAGTGSQLLEPPTLQEVSAQEPTEEPSDITENDEAMRADDDAEQSEEEENYTLEVSNKFNLLQELEDAENDA